MSKITLQRSEGQFRGQKIEAPSKCPEKWLKKLLSPKKKIMSQSFLNRGTLVIYVFLQPWALNYVPQFLKLN
jgi:hypothetical protein